MTLQQYGEFYGSDKATHHKYCDFYQAYLGRPKVILEIGVKDGASLKMWRDYYKALVIGLDINPIKPIEGCLTYQKDATHIETRNMLTELIPSFDLIVDDGSHHVIDQMEAFYLWFPFLSAGGVYIIEDIHTQHFTEYNPMGKDLEAWIRSLGYETKYYWRNPEDHSDSGTVLIYKP